MKNLLTTAGRGNWTHDSWLEIGYRFRSSTPESQATKSIRDSKGQHSSLAWFYCPHPDYRAPAGTTQPACMILLPTPRLQGARRDNTARLHDSTAHTPTTGRPQGQHSSLAWFYCPHPDYRAPAGTTQPACMILPPTPRLQGAGGDNTARLHDSAAHTPTTGRPRGQHSPLAWFCRPHPDYRAPAGTTQPACMILPPTPRLQGARRDNTARLHDSAAHTPTTGRPQGQHSPLAWFCRPHPDYRAPAGTTRLACMILPPTPRLQGARGDNTARLHDSTAHTPTTGRPQGQHGSLAWFCRPHPDYRAPVGTTQPACMILLPTPRLQGAGGVPWGYRRQQASSFTSPICGPAFLCLRQRKNFSV